MNQYESLFEAPAAHEATFEASPYAGQESAFEWEQPEATHQEIPEIGYELSGYASQEDEADPFLGKILGAIGLGEEEWESPELSGYASQEGEAGAFLGEDEWELPELSGYASQEDEADLFFGKILRAARGVAKKIAPLARAIAPKAISALAGMIPGVGSIAGPLLGKLTGSLLKEAEDEVGAMEASHFHPEALGEAGYETAHEAALTELLAAEAAQAGSEAEAEAILAGSLPITITIMGGRRALRPVLPTLAQANGRLVRVIRREGPAGRQLLRLVPSIQRRTVAVIRGAARRGVPITGALATRAMATSAGSVLASPRTIRRALERNAVVRLRVAPASPRRAAVFAPGSASAPRPQRLVR